MPTLNDVLAGSLAQAVQVQQIIDALKGTPNKGVPVSLVSLNDPANYALTVQNDDPTNSRALLVLKADGTTLIAADATGVTLGSPVNLAAGSINGGTALANASITNAKLGPDVARANLLTNGGFEVWQRGNGPFAVGALGSADRWGVEGAGTDALSVSRDTTNVDTAGGSGAAAACTATKGTGGVGALKLTQNCKASDGYQLQNRVVSLSVRVRTSTPNAVRIGLYNGSATTYSAYHTGDGTWQTLSATVTMIGGATLLQAAIVFEASCTAYVDNANLVVGSQPADYVPLHPADDLARCSRYYETLGNMGVTEYLALGQAYSTTDANGPIRYTTRKAVVPTVSIVGAFSMQSAGAALIGATALAFVNVSVAGATYHATVASGLVAGNATTLVQSAATSAIIVEANP